MLVLCAIASQAQVLININTGKPPPWGPVGYSEARYYYLPDVESYYDIPATQFICFVKGKWVHRDRLPSRYRNYDLYDGYKVVITDYKGKAPYRHFDENKAEYAKGFRGPAQQTIGEKPGKEKGDVDESGTANEMMKTKDRVMEKIRRNEFTFRINWKH